MSCSSRMHLLLLLAAGVIGIIEKSSAIVAAGYGSERGEFAPHKNCSTSLPWNFDRIRKCHCFCRDENQQSFVLKTKKLKLQSKDAVMPSMIISPLNASELIVFSQAGHMSWRTVSYQSVSSSSYITTNGISSTGIVGKFSTRSACLDFRIFLFNSSYFLINFQNFLSRNWMAQSQFKLVNRTFASVRSTETPLRLSQQAQFEKNWAPFSFTNTDIPAYQPQLLYEYSVNPHRILMNIPKDSKTGVNTKIFTCTQLTSNNDIFWNSSHMRSGTPAVLLKEYNVYLSFFHVLEYFTTKSDIKTYVMGAHTFDANPPFAIRQVSPEPIVADGFFKGPYAYKRLNYQIYPSQFFVDDDKLVLSVLRQDSQCWVVEMSLSGLMASLQPVETENCSSTSARIEAYRHRVRVSRHNNVK